MHLRVAHRQRSRDITCRPRWVPTYVVPVSVNAGTQHLRFHVVPAQAQTLAGTIDTHLHVQPAQALTLAGTAHRHLHVVPALPPPFANPAHRTINVGGARPPAYADTFHRRLHVVAAETAAALATSGLAVTLYDRRHLTSPVVTYAAAQQRKWRHAPSDVGSFSFTIQNDDGHFADAQPQRIAAFSDNGLRTWQGIIERLEKTAVAPGEETDEQTIITGRGIAALLEEAGVYPEGPLTREPVADARNFNFASSGLDRSAWTAPVEIARWSTLGIFGRQTPIIPMDWPVPPIGVSEPPTKFIWSRPLEIDGDYHRTPVGTSYFAGVLTLTGTDDRLVRFFTVVDDNFELWVDGIQIDSYIGTGIEGWFNTHSHDITMSAGTHLVAIKATNIDRPGNLANFGSVYHEAWTISDGSDQLDEAVLWTSDAWVCVDYPGEPPGFTPGATLLTLIGEGQARGVLNDLTVTFTATHDSNGTAWPGNVDFTFGVDKNLLDVLAQMGETTVDWDMSPTGFELNVYVKDGLGTSSGVTLEPGVNISELSYTRVG